MISFPPPSATCAHAWCTTEHGRTTHPDDEDHRSSGVLVAATVRAPGSTPNDTEVEIGILHRRDDDETWLVIDDGHDVRLELTLASARRIVRAVRNDLALTSALH